MWKWCELQPTGSFQTWSLYKQQCFCKLQVPVLSFWLPLCGWTNKILSLVQLKEQKSSLGLTTVQSGLQRPEPTGCFSYSVFNTSYWTELQFLSILLHCIYWTKISYISLSGSAVWVWIYSCGDQLHNTLIIHQLCHNRVWMGKFTIWG